MTRKHDSTREVSRRTLLTSAATAGAIVSGATAIGAGTAGGGEGTADSDEQREFAAVLSPENAVPADGDNLPYDDPAAHGEATFHLDGDELFWSIELSNIRCVTGGHIHEGAPDENGPHVAELFNLPEKSDEIDGTFREGTFGEGDTCGDELQNCLNEGVTFDDLLEKMRTGNAYVQIHAADHEVIRGQIE